MNQARCNVFRLNPSEISENYQEYDEDPGAFISFTYNNREFFEILTNYVLETYGDDINRGDCIQVGEETDDNAGTFFWNGTEAIDLCPDFREAGSAPSSFIVGEEFCPEYWSNAIAARTHFFMPTWSLKQMVIDSLQFNDEHTTTEQWWGEYECNGETFKIFFSKASRVSNTVGVAISREELIEWISDQTTPFCVSTPGRSLRHCMDFKETFDWSRMGVMTINLLMMTFLLAEQGSNGSDVSDSDE